MNRKQYISPQCEKTSIATTLIVCMSLGGTPTSLEDGPEYGGEFHGTGDAGAKNRSDDTWSENDAWAEGGLW